MAFSWSAPSDELTCPVCQDIFTDPVLLTCSHTFCNRCVLKWWATKRTRLCPVCKTVSPAGAPPRNLVLNNLCQEFLMELDSGLVCRQHSERLKLYCLDHGVPVCVVCRDSQTHVGHGFIPVDEAASMYRSVLRRVLEPLQEKVKLFHQTKVSWEKMDEEIKSQAHDTEEKIKEQFRMLREFLQKQEKTRIAALKLEEESKSQALRKRIEDLCREISTMESTVNTIKGGLRDADVSLLLRAATLNREAQRPLPDHPQQLTGGLINVANHLGNMNFNIWLQMKEMVSYSPVILDPNTAHRELHLSENLTTVVRQQKQPLCVLLSSQPERMQQHRSVLGCQGFTSGTHVWEVEVGDNRVWALGVMAQDAHRMGDMLSGLWMVRFCGGKFTAFSPSRPVSIAPMKDRPQRVRVHLDRDKGKLSFSDPDTNAVIHTFTHTFTSKIFPYINTWDEHPLKIVPLKLSVIAA